MALKGVYAKIEDVPETLREHYTKGDDGRAYLNVAEGLDDLPAVRGLRISRDEFREEKKKLVEKYAGVDIEELKAAKAKLAELEAGNRGGKNDEKIAQLESTISQLTKSAAQEKAALEAERDQARFEKDSYIIESEIRGALGEPDIKGNRLFLEHLLKPMTKYVNGKAVIVDEKGNVRLKSSMGEPLTPADVLRDWKANRQDLAPAFATSGGSGSGAAGSGGGSGTAVGTVRAGSKEYFANLDKVAKGELKIAPAEG